jgi:cyclopropane fatty-acyl-phospholipid synthase-like methyltransferase
MSYFARIFENGALSRYLGVVKSVNALNTTDAAMHSSKKRYARTIRLRRTSIAQNIFSSPLYRNKTLLK